MLNIINSHIISIIIFFPFITSLLLLIKPQLRHAQQLALLSTLFTFIISGYIWYQFDPNTYQLQFYESYPWISELGIQYTVGIDGINLLLVMLTTFLTPIIIGSISNKANNKNRLLSLILFIESGIIGAFTSFDLILFCFFWELILIPIYIIIGMWGEKNRTYASNQFIIFNVLGSLLLLFAVISIVNLHYNEFGFYSSNILKLYKTTSLPKQWQHWLFIAFAIAFAIRAPIWPFHSWLPLP